VIGSLLRNPVGFSKSYYEGGQIRNIKRAILILGWAVLSLAAGQQWFGPSPDLVNYLAYYNSITPYFDFAGSRFEYGFQFVAWIWVGLGLSYSSFFVTLAAFSLGIKFYLFDQYLSSPLLAAFSYVLAFYLLHEYTQIRSAVGISLALLGIHALIERRWLRFALFTIGGVLFHYSTVILPLIALASLRIEGRLAAALSALFLIAGSAALPMIQDLIVDTFSSLNPLTTAYVYNDQNAEVANIFSFTSVMMVGIILVTLANPAVFHSKYNKAFFLMTLVSYISLILLRDSLELALRLRDALAVGTVFLVFREPLTMRQLPLALLWFLAAAYLYYTYSTTQVLI